MDQPILATLSVANPSICSSSNARDNTQCFVRCRAYARSAALLCIANCMHYQWREGSQKGTNLSMVGYSCALDSDRPLVFAFRELGSYEQRNMRKYRVANCKWKLNEETFSTENRYGSESESNAQTRESKLHLPRNVAGKLSDPSVNRRKPSSGTLTASRTAARAKQDGETRTAPENISRSCTL